MGEDVTTTNSGAGEGNRTLVISLEGFSSTIELRPLRVSTLNFAALLFWWRRLDSNQRRHKPTDLQSAPFSHSGTPPSENYGLWANGLTVSTAHGCKFGAQIPMLLPIGVFCAGVLHDTPQMRKLLVAGAACRREPRPGARRLSARDGRAARRAHDPAINAGCSRSDDFWRLKAKSPARLSRAFWGVTA